MSQDSHQVSLCVKVSDHTKPFIEDTSETGVWAILSLCFSDKTKMNLTFFPKKLIPNKQNQDNDNKELLEVKLVLEEWHNWMQIEPTPSPLGPVLHLIPLHVVLLAQFVTLSHLSVPTSECTKMILVPYKTVNHSDPQIRSSPTIQWSIRKGQSGNQVLPRGILF